MKRPCLYGPVTFLTGRVVQHNCCGDFCGVEYRRQIVSVVFGNGVDNRLASGGMGLPEAERPGRHDVGMVAVGPQDSRFVEVAGAGNVAAAYDVLRLRHQQLCRAQPSIGLQFVDLGAAVQFSEQVIKTFRLDSRHGVAVKPRTLPGHWSIARSQPVAEA